MKNEPEVSYIRKVVEEVCKVQDISIRTRRLEICVPRHMYFYFCVKFTNLGFSYIGRTLNRKHGTVKNSVEVIENFLDNRNEYTTVINEVDEILTKKYPIKVFKNTKKTRMSAQALRQIDFLNKKIRDLQIQLMQTKNKFTSSKYKDLQKHIHKIPEKHIDMFCETRIEPFVKMYGN